MTDSNKAKVKKQNRITIIALLIIFASPVLFAYSAFFFGWYEGHDTVNKGQMLKPALQREAFDLTALDGQPIDQQKDMVSKWWLIYPTMNNTCNKECVLHLNLMRQVHTALGKDAVRRDDGRNRIGRALWVSPQFQADADYQDLTVVRNPVAAGHFVSKDGNSKLEPGYIYLTDPLGNIILRYGPFLNEATIAVDGKALMKDLKKLLKNSRLG